MTAVKETPGIQRWFTFVPRNYHFLVVAVLLALLVIIHYHEALVNVWFLERISSFLEFGLTRQTFGRILFLAPITYGTITLGRGAGISILVLTAAAMLPRVFLFSTAPREALFETIGVLFTGLLIVLLVDVLHKARSRLVELEKARKTLAQQIDRLSLLQAISSAVSQSLKLEDVLANVKTTRELIQADVSWLYLWDSAQNVLRLVASKGLPEPNLPGLVLPGEGPDGRVTGSRQPVIVENAWSDATTAATPWKQREIQSILTVPLIVKGDFLGTLGVGYRLEHHSSPEEIDLLRATADQLGMAVENARLYERQQSIAEALRVSERNYRELFESASDSIWVHDLDGKILALNSAFEKLTGYERAALLNADVSMLLSAHGKGSVDEKAHDLALSGDIPRPFEQELIKKDGSIVIVQIGTSLITKDGKPWAFQHIARDITEDKKIQDNLKFYVQQVSQAQEAERKRIARELHDDTAQALVAIVRNLDDFASGHSRFSVKEIQEQVRDVLREIRRFSQQLRPSVLDDLGLVPAVKWLTSDFTKNYGVPADVIVTGEPRPLSPDAELMLFRITQEALTNAQKHSGASRIGITLEFTAQAARITVNDNGRGFSLPERMVDLARNGKLGLAGMQERAQLLGGNFFIASKLGVGTILTIEVPLKLAGPDL